jgi:hypothetical protein
MPTRWSWAAWCVVLAATHGVAAGAVGIELYPDVDADATIDLELRVDGRVQCVIKKESGIAAASTQPACRFELPAQARSLSVRGEYGAAASASQRRWARKGEFSANLLDFAPVSRLLDAPAKSYGERVADFVMAANRFQHAYAPDHPLGLETAKPASAERIDAAQQRLGYALPGDFVSMQRVVGALRIGDHHVTAIDDVADAYIQMRKDWGTPEAAMQSDYSASEQIALRASTLLFTEVGDGLGGLRYRPPPTKSCGGRAAYFWIAQESAGGQLKAANGDCMDFAGAFRWLLEGFVVEDLASELAEQNGALLFDSSRAVQRLDLRLDREAAPFHADLSIRWQGPNS